MPDTHLAMPRTLSAPYAELLEAEAPETMTTSDAPPNGTAAAAAAFARLLASGDQAMQPETSPITEFPAANAPACDAAHGPHDLRAMLLGSTTLPALGMTIAEASQKTADLLAENDGPGPLTDDQADALAVQWTVLENVVIGSSPRTILDAASILDRVFPDDATHIPQRDIPAVRRVATFLHHVVEAARSASPEETSIIPSIGMTFRQAADRVRELLKRGSSDLKDDPEDAVELERVEMERFSDAGEWSRIERAILATPTQTVGDLLAKVERLACPELGIRHLVFPDEEIALLEEDVQRLQPLWGEIGPFALGEGHPDSDILALGRRRGELIDQIDQPGRSDDEITPLYIEWKEVDHLIMELQPKTGAGLAVQLATVWYQLEPEPGGEHCPKADSTLDRVWLWTAMKNAERIGGGALPAPDCQDADAAIFAAYGRWAQLVRDSNAAKTDEDCERLSDQADAAALDVINHEPVTPEGLATQVYAMLHLEHGCTMADNLDINFSPTCEQEGSASNIAVRALFDRVKRLGRRDGTAAGEEALTGLYTRWMEVRSRYLADGLSDEESDALEGELDRIEDRLEAEPVRCVADAVAKLGYYLKRSNALLDDELLPAIDANSSNAWQRILFAIEDSTERLPNDMQESFRAMVTGLRQLMQRHVKLVEDVERRADVYQLPDEVSRAMQAACARNMAASAEKDVREPDQAQGQREEALSLFLALKPDNRKNFLSFMRFLTVSSHLHSAMLDFAREHGMTSHYREWLKGHHADVADEQAGTAADDAPQKEAATDIDLSNAYDALLDAMRAESALPEAMSDEDCEPYEKARMVAADHLVTLAPETPRGAAILLRYLFLRSLRMIDAERAFLRGAEPNEEDLTDFQARILWQVVKMLEALPAAANDQHQGADSFTDTVAAFEAEAPVTLALPLAPTGRMVDAGANAAGITPAQFQAAYAAAVEALKLERAA